MVLTLSLLVDLQVVVIDELCQVLLQVGVVVADLSDVSWVQKHIIKFLVNSKFQIFLNFRM